MRHLFSVLFLLSALIPGVSWPAEEFRIGQYRALSLFGEPGLLPGTDYVSFAGDFGFSGRLPPKDAIERHLAQESALLSNFQLRVINLESMLPGGSGLDLDRQIDGAMIDILKRTGYDVVSRANNHALDFDREGVLYNTTELKKAGFKMIGLREFPVYEWEARGYKIAIYALTGYTDREDGEHLILKIEDADLSLIKQATSKADFRIVFVHLGSMGFFPSPHERRQVNRLFDIGADLVVGTGSHFIKGFVRERGRPVIYGIGNHMFSYVDGDTEPVGMYLVAGFTKGELVQLFVVPFHNAIMKGRTGPLDEIVLASFKKTLLDRSSSDPNRYYSDPHSLEALKERLSRFSLFSLEEIKPRYIVYAAGIVFHNYPVVATGGCILTVSFSALLVRWTILTRRRRKAIRESIGSCHS